MVRLNARVKTLKTRVFPRQSTPAGDSPATSCSASWNVADLVLARIGATAMRALAGAWSRLRQHHVATPSARAAGRLAPAHHADVAARYLQRRLVLSMRLGRQRRHPSRLARCTDAGVAVDMTVSGTGRRRRCAVTDRRVRAPAAASDGARHLAAVMPFAPTCTLSRRGNLASRMPQQSTRS